MSAECKEKNIFGGKCRGTKEECLNRCVLTKFASMTDTNKPSVLDKTTAKALSDTRPNCIHKEEVDQGILGYIGLMENPQKEEPDIDDSPTLTGFSLNLLSGGK
jgi:hypothetical protein